MMRSDLRWCSDGFEFACWNGEIVRVAFILDAHDREIIAWRAPAIRDQRLRHPGHDARGRGGRFGDLRAPHPVEWLSDNGSIYTARETRVFAAQLNWFPASRQWRAPRATA